MVNDTFLMTTIVVVFFLLGFITPQIQNSFNVESSINNEQIIDGSEDVSATTVFLNVVKMFFWTFGTLPAWLDLILEVFRVQLYILVAKFVRGIGG